MSFWRKTIDEVMKEFSSSNIGLDDRDVEERLRRYGQNDIPERALSCLEISSFTSP